jgi:hypothetical protein
LRKIKHQGHATTKKSGRALAARKRAVSFGMTQRSNEKTANTFMLEQGTGSGAGCAAFAPGGDNTTSPFTDG